MTYTVEQTQTFERWLRSMRDLRAKIAIARRVERASAGHFGDVKPVGEGVSEMRVDTGPGYRVYFTVRAGVVIVLLAAGSKASQSGDIQMARKLAKEV